MLCCPHGESVSCYVVHMVTVYISVLCMWILLRCANGESGSDCFVHMVRFFFGVVHMVRLGHGVFCASLVQLYRHVY